MLAAAVVAFAIPSAAQADPPGGVAYNCQPSGSAGFTPLQNNTQSAQTFTPTRDGRLSGINLGQIARAPGGSGGPITVRLLTTSGGIPTTNVLASTTIPASEILNDNFFHPYEVAFDMASSPLLRTTTTYAVSLSTSDTAQNVWQMYPDTCAGGLYYDATGPFTKPAGGDYDARIKVWTGQPNDDFDDAVTISGHDAQINGEVWGATNQPGAEYTTEDLDSSWATNSVWYSWTAVASGPTTIDTCTTDYDSFLVVFTGSALGSLNVVAAANNFCPTGFGSKVEFDAVEGETYSILVDGCCGAPQGTFTLKVDGQPAPVPPDPPITPDTTAPETTITKAPKKKIKSRKRKVNVKLALGSSEPGSTFECSVDGKPFAPCSGSLKLKSKRGKHTFAARATDGAGNTDATPATAKWKVKRKR